MWLIQQCLNIFNSSQSATVTCSNAMCDSKLIYLLKKPYKDKRICQVYKKNVFEKSEKVIKIWKSDKNKNFKNWYEINTISQVIILIMW